MSTFKTMAIAVAALGFAVAPAAFAVPSDTVRVKIDARYLETDWGVEKIYKTLSRKAESACNVRSPRSPAIQKYEQDCMSDLLDDFIQSADHERLTTYHAGMTK